MGNKFSFNLQANVDSMVFKCCQCTNGQAKYVYRLEANLDSLKKALEELTDAKNDLMRRVNVAEQELKLTRLDTVQRWISRAEALEIEGNQVLLEGTQELSNLFFWGCCSKNYNSSYKLGKEVSEKLAEVTYLKTNGDFEVVAD